MLNPAIEYLQQNLLLKEFHFYRGTEIGVLASGQQPEDSYRISMEHYRKIASDDSKTYAWRFTFTVNMQ